MVETRLVAGPLPEPPSDRVVPEGGAELVFHGRVRPLEEGREIVALDYEHYEGMAEKELRALAEEAHRRFELLDLVALHRVGRVPVGEASLRVVLWSRHRREGIEALTWFIRELKQRVPIWKWGVTREGERFPSHHCGE